MSDPVSSHTCTICDHEIPAGALRCPHCGEPQDVPDDPDKEEKTAAKQEIFSALGSAVVLVPPLGCIVAPIILLIVSPLVAFLTGLVSVSLGKVGGTVFSCWPLLVVAPIGRSLIRKSQGQSNDSVRSKFQTAAATVIFLGVAASTIGVVAILTLAR